MHRRLTFLAAFLLGMSGCASKAETEPEHGESPAAKTPVPETRRDAGVTAGPASTSDAPAVAGQLDAMPPAADSAAWEPIYGEKEHATATHKRKKKHRPGLPLKPSDLVIALSGQDHVVAVASPISASKPVKRKDWLVQRKVSLRIIEVLEGEETETAIEAFEIVALRKDFMTVEDTQVVVLAPCREKGGRLQLVVKSFFYPTWPQLRLLGDLGKKQSPREANPPVRCDRATLSAAGQKIMEEHQ